MDTAKIKTLRQVSEAISEVDDARAAAKNDTTISQAQKDALDHSSVLLRRLLNDILLQNEQVLIDALRVDTVEMNVLITTIGNAVTSLSSVSNTIQKLSTSVGALITIATTTVSAGLI